MSENSFEQWAQANVIGTGSNYQAAKLAWREARRSGVREVIDWIESHETSSSWTVTDLKRAVGIADA